MTTVTLKALGGMFAKLWLFKCLIYRIILTQRHHGNVTWGLRQLIPLTTHLFVWIRLTINTSSDLWITGPLWVTNGFRTQKDQECEKSFHIVTSYCCIPTPGSFCALWCPNSIRHQDRITYAHFSQRYNFTGEYFNNNFNACQHQWEGMLFRLVHFPCCNVFPYSKIQTFVIF